MEDREGGVLRVTGSGYGKIKNDKLCRVDTLEQFRISISSSIQRGATA